MLETGVVFNIQRFSIHDGPGIRTTVFLKGCPLRCFWCHNPEGRHKHLEIRYSPTRCIACGACVTACTQQAHSLRDGHHEFLREKCQGSGVCVETCYSGALELTGRVVSASEVLQEVLRDKPFYGTSGGGVTLSGGEPAFQARFSRKILELCKGEGIHTAVETCGETSWSTLETLLPLADLVMMDLKHADPVRHRRATGASNELLLANARRLALTGKPLIFRTPVVPSVNDTVEEIAAIAAFVQELIQMRQEACNRTANAAPGQNGAGRSVPGNSRTGISTGIRYELLPFHRLASDKYAGLGLDYTASSLQPPSMELLHSLLSVAQQYGLDARIG